MKPTFTRLAPVIAALFISLFFSFSVASQTISEDYQDGKIYLKFNDSEPISFTVNDDNTVDVNSVPVVNKLKDQFTITALSRPFFINNDGKLLRTLLLEIAEIDKTDQVISRLSAEPVLEYAEKVPLDRVYYLPNDSLYTLYNGPQNWNWHLELIQAEQAWDISKGSADIAVGVVDNAVWVDHPDLAGKIIAQRDVVYGTNNANPPPAGNKEAWSHGTHVAGLVGAASDNGIGVASVGYNVSIIAVKASNNSNPTSIAGGYTGIQWAANNGADVINMSWGGPGFSQTNQNTINAIYNMGVVLVAAAGNDNVSAPHYPSAYQNVISIASIDYNDQKSGFSNYSTTVDLSSPGGVASPGPGGVLSTVWSDHTLGNYDAYIGTSMASPVAAGLAALVLSVNPDLTPAQVEQILESSADDISAQNPSYPGMLGAGRINAFRAVSSTPYTPVSAFNTPVNVITPGTAINFESEAAGIPTTWQWTFEGGTPGVSSDTNPQNVLYQNEGTYDVTLTVSNAFGTNTVSYPDYIQVTATPAPYIIMSVSDTLPCIAEAITLTDNSLYQPTSWEWSIEPSGFEFVNGTSASSQNPDVIFLNQGYYSINLTAFNQNGQSSAQLSDAINVRGITPPYSFTFEDGTSEYFVLWDTIKSQSGIHIRAANNSTRGIHFQGDPVPTGWKGSPTGGTPEQVWNENRIFQSEASICGVDARSFTNGVKLELDLKQTYSLGDKYSWFRVLVNGSPIADYSGKVNFNPVTAGSDPWQRLEFDLTPYAGEVFDLTLQGCARFSDKVQGEGDNILIDNVVITGSVPVKMISSESNGISVFPNPATDKINVRVSGITRQSKIEIISSNGNVMYRGYLLPGTEVFEYPTDKLAPGLYLIRVLKNSISEVSTKVLVTGVQ